MRPLTRTLLILTLFVFLAIGLVAAGVRLVRRGPRPNVVIVLIDTLRVDALSCYGNPRPTSPNIDGIARDGSLYLRAISPSPWTAPAVASIFTGFLPSEHGLHLENLSLDKSRETLAEILGEAGYDSLAISNNPFISPHFRMDQGFRRFDEIWPEHIRAEDYPDQGAAKTNTLVRTWLDERRDREKPFFLLVHYMEPHLPYDPPAPYDRKFLHEGVKPELLDKVRSWESPFELGYILGMNKVTPEEFAALRTQYDGEVGYVDEKVGELVGMLKERGVYDDTVLVLTSDHGENIGDHGLMDHKFCVYDTLLQVPLILRYPPGITPGEEVDLPVQTLDIFPTVLDLAGIRHDPLLRARSLLERDPDPRALVAQHYRPLMFLEAAEGHFPQAPRDAFDIFNRRLVSVEQGGLKLIWSSDDRHELYDLGADPGETRNVFKDRPEDAKRLQQKVKEVME